MRARALVLDDAPQPLVDALRDERLGEGWGEGEGEGEGLTLPLPPTICTRRTWSSAHAKMSTTCPAVTARLATAW